MRKSRDGVGGYRGRRTLTEVLKLIAIVLAVIVVLVLAGLMAGQRFIVYSDDGLRLDLPFFQQEEPERPAVEPGNINMIERPGDTWEEETPAPEPEEPAYVMSALALSIEEIVNGTAAQTLEQAGANAVVLEMKNMEGTLGWAAQNELARSVGVSGAESVNEALRQWLEGDVYTVARVCCFRDNTVPYHHNNMALRATYGNWRDELGLRWLNPSGGESQAYLAALCGELARLGFDEILLESYAFPGQGNQEVITSQAPGGRSQAAEEFLTLAQQAVSAHGAKLSVRVEHTVLTGEDMVSGLSVELLERHADRLWVDGADLSAAEVLMPQEAGERLVRVEPVLAGEPQGHQARLDKNQ